METDAELSSKTTVVEASKQANAVFISAIQALKMVERDATDGAVTTAFTAQHQTLLEQNNALEATLAASEEKSVFDEATLTGYGNREHNHLTGLTLKRPSLISNP
jgi:hypothetical protein